MGYQVLARKYRPQRFEDVVQQTHITQALANAVTTGRLAHAILLSGPRGTGKTTIARILAKCVNCEAGPAATPCNVCRSCREITSGHAADVFEIDGASNNKVENIRELRENAHYMPAHSLYKIYIIDEVHMLSDSAFNALLKILEEPPAHVKFFFATTEPNKIPITILSRCQRHDCRRVDINSIIKHMARLCDEESIDIQPEALTIIAREADGSIRDALSLLDLIITSTPGHIGTELVLDVLGGLDRQSLFDISKAVFDRNAGSIIEIIGRLYDRGHNMTRLFSELMEHFRNLLVVKLNGTTDVLNDVSEFELNAMRSQIQNIPGIYLNQILDMLFKEEYTIRQSSSPKLAVEMAFIRAVCIPPALSIDTLIEKIDSLQKNLPDSASGEAAVPPSQPTTFTKQAAATETYPAPVAEKKDQPHEIKETTPAEAFTSEPAAPHLNVFQDGESLEASWKKILENVTKDNPALSACFADSQLKKTGDGQIEVSFKTKQFNITYACRDENRVILQTACSQYFGNDIQISLSGELATSRTGPTRKNEAKLIENEALNHPLVEEAMKLFNGKIVEIKILQET